MDELRFNEVGDGVHESEVGVDPKDKVGIQRVLNQYKMPKDVVHRKLDEFLRIVVQGKLEDMHADSKISAELDRRIEVACIGAMGNVRERADAIAERLLVERLTKIIAQMPLTVEVAGKSPVDAPQETDK